MLLNKKIKKANLYYPLLVLFLANCSTQLEDRASVDFEPNVPVASKKVNKDKYGSIYSNRGRISDYGHSAHMYAPRAHAAR